MVTLNAKVEHMNQLFQKDHIKVDSEWLLGCVEWFLSESPNISNAELYQQSQQQWLLSSIIESGTASFPTTILDSSTLLTLDGYYPVQMQYILDISESPYDQLRKLYNQQLDEGDDEMQRRQPTAAQSKKKRVLKLEITDGHVTLNAMEYSPIACLNTKLSPGCKLLLIGPIRCCNKVLLLEPKNVRILGGEMEALLITNAFENVLLRLLNKPENPNPKTEYHEPVVVEQENVIRPIRQAPQRSTAIQPPIGRQHNFANDDFDDDDVLLSNVVDMVEQNCRPPNSDTANSHANLLADDDDDDLWLAEIPVEPAAAVEPIHPPSVSRQSSIRIRSPSSLLKTPPSMPNRTAEPNPVRAPNCIDDDDFDMLVDLETEIKQELLAVQDQTDGEPQLHSTPRITTTLGQPSAATITSQLSATTSNIVPTRQPSIKATAPILIETECYPFKIRGCNLVTVDQLATIDDAEKQGKCFIVKAKIDKFFERLQIYRCHWSLGAFLSHNESVSLLQVRFNDAVLSELIQYSGRELTTMRELSVTRPQLHDEMKLIIEQLKAILMELHCFMKISYLTPTEYPIVIECIDSAPILERIWSNKLAEENL